MNRNCKDTIAIEGDQAKVQSYNAYLRHAARWPTMTTVSAVRKALVREYDIKEVLKKYAISEYLRNNRWIILKRITNTRTMIVMPREDANKTLEFSNNSYPILGSYDDLSSEFKLDLDGSDVLISTTEKSLMNLYDIHGIWPDHNAKEVVEDQEDVLRWADKVITFINKHY